LGEPAGWDDVWHDPPIVLADRMFVMVLRYLNQTARGHVRYKDQTIRLIEEALDWLNTRIPGFTSLALQGVCPVCGKRFKSIRYLTPHLERNSCGTVVFDELVHWAVARRRRKLGKPFTPPPPPQTYALLQASRAGRAPTRSPR
jgi:hypothetical protein